jgi:hypothetical protein
MITLFIHGTLFSPARMTPFYELFYTPRGLTSVIDVPSKYRIKHILYDICEKDPDNFNLFHTYTFGWSGKLNNKVRKKASLDLFYALKKCIATYEKEYNKQTFIRIIGHSHGGNVALYLGYYADQKKFCNIAIDELILLACPVQKATLHYTQSSLFKQIYSFHSESDMIQVADPQGLWLSQDIFKEQNVSPHSIHQSYPFFSQRHFSPQKNLININVTLNNHHLFHIDFILRDFLIMLPDALHTLKKHQRDPFLTQYSDDILLNIKI